MKGKLNINFEISDRDRKLLILLLAVGIFAAAWFFGYNNLMQVTQNYQQETQKLKQKKIDLMEKNNNKEKYTADTQMYKNIYNHVFAGYDNGKTQDSMLVYLTKVESITGAWLKSVSFAESSDIYTFGNIVSTNPSVSGQKVYTSDMKGKQNTVTLGYEATYSQWKDMIAYINGYYSKNKIDSISMAYNSATDTVTGNLTLSAYSITGSKRVFTSPQINGATGTDNIFDSDDFYGYGGADASDKGDSILSDYDCYIMLNAAASDVDACIIGRRNDTTNESVITSNNNSVENVTFIVSGSNGNYKVQYKIGDVTYPAQDYDLGKEIDPGDTMALFIMSSSRVSDKDLSGINLSIENNSDKTLNIKTTNDDKTAPRVNIINKTGNIVIY